MPCLFLTVFPSLALAVSNIITNFAAQKYRTLVSGLSKRKGQMPV